MFYCLLAKGFEEIEAIATVDILRRAGISVMTVAVNSLNKDIVYGAHDIAITADTKIKDIHLEDVEGIILPGGMPGTLNLERNKLVSRLVDYCGQHNCYIFAICAAPQILGHKGILKDKEATCYPGFEGELIGAKYSESLVIQDGKIITGKGPGATIDFALAIVKELKGEKIADYLRESLQCGKD